MFEGKDVKVLLANAGAGKTSKLMDILLEELKVRRPEEIAFVTFTKKGASEGLKRACDRFKITPNDLPYFRTLHSLTFHALNLKLDNVFGKIDERRFNKETGYYLNRCDANANVHQSKDSKYMDFYDLERSNAITSKQIAEADIEIGYYRQLVQKYEEYKSQHHLVDFFDCLIKYVQDGDSLPCKVVMIDECLSPDTEVRMADMSIKKIKDIEVGDSVMGTHGATKVVDKCTGVDYMYDVYTGKKQLKFTCNSRHLIQAKSKAKEGFTWRHAEDINRGAFYNYKGYDGKEVDLAVDPYFFGLWLGNGLSRECAVICNDKDTATIKWLVQYGESNGDSVRLRKRPGIYQVEYANGDKFVRIKSHTRKALETYGFMLDKTVSNKNRVYKEKEIPDVFLKSSREQRLKLMAGIIDSDGMYVDAGKHKKYRVEMTREKLMQQIYSLASSLGFNPSWYETYHKTNGITRKYYRVDFYGSKDIPCLLERKQFKGDFTHGIQTCRVVSSGIGDYVGITVDAEDNLFLLANGAIVHNCQDITALQWKVIEKAFSKAEKVYVAGDENQSIYTYAGARPDYLIAMANKYPRIELKASYRLPKRVYDVSKGIVNLINEKTDKAFDFKEGNDLGNVVSLNDLSRLKNYLNSTELKNDKNCQWYLLARNNCFLKKYEKLLEEELIPYWNADGFFMGGEIMSRIKDYEGFALEGYKTPEKREQFRNKFGITDFSVPFYETSLFTEGRKWVYASYIEKYGLEKLQEMCKWNPQILLSTIHYVKGGEAKNVALMLDSTVKTYSEIYENIDSELRVLYVGVTRAKENLYLVDSHSNFGFDKLMNIVKEENGLDW